MSYIFISGMHEDWCGFAQARLQEMGVAAVSADADHGLDLASFTQKLCKTYKVSTARSSKFRQISVGRAWQITAASIVVENADKGSWSWGHPDNIFLLDFWKNFDPLCNFVLVYGSFADFIARTPEAKARTTANNERLVQRWAAYHAEMVRFYHENQDRCILLNIRSFENEVGKIVNLLMERFDAAARIINSHASLETNPLLAMLSENTVDTIDAEDIGVIFSELESSADIVYDEKSNRGHLLDAAREQLATLVETTKKQDESLAAEKQKFEQALREFSAQRNLYEEALSENGELVQQGDKMRAELEKLKTQCSSLEKRAGRAEEQYLETRAKFDNASSENNLMLSQLKQAHEELEYYFRKSHELEAGSSDGEASATDINSKVPIEPERQNDLRRDIRDDLPQKIVVEFTNFFNGSGWHNAEQAGRWAGPGKSSALNIPKMVVSDYRMVLRITDGMSLAILENLRVSLNGRPLKLSLDKLCDLGGALAPLRRLKAGLNNIEKPYPVEFTANIPGSYLDPNQPNQVFGFEVIGSISPASSGASDTRELSLFYESLTLTSR